MPFEPVFEKINYCKRKGILTDRIKVECRTDVPAESVERVLNVSAAQCMGGGTAAEGKLDYGGKITFFICYRTVEGDIRKCECGAEFTGSISDASVTEGARSRISCRAEKTEASLSGVKLSVTAYLEIKAEITERVSSSALSGGENLITETKEFSYVKGFGERETVYSAEDEYEIPFRAEEVISHRAQATVTAVQCGVGVIIVDGEVYLSAIFLQSGDKKDIIRENRTVPFRAEIECEDAMPAFSATARVQVRSLKTDVGVDEEGGTSTVTSVAALKITGEAFSEEKVSLSEDAFSLSEEVELEPEQIECYKECEVRSFSVKTGGRASIEELPAGSFAYAACGETAEITESTYDNGTLKVTGTLSMTGLFCDAENKAFARKAEVPFEITEDITLPEGAEYDISVAATRAGIRVASETEADIEAELAFTVYPVEKTSLKCIKDVRATGEKTPCDCAISVYIPTRGEELWSLAKRLNIAPENLVSTNKELRFPLTGEERIVIYRCK